MKRTIHEHEIPYVRRWRGTLLSPVEEVLMFHDEAGPVQDTFRRLRVALERERIDYVVIGALALGAHHFRRATEDVDLCLRAEDIERFRKDLVGSLYQGVEGRRRRFYDPQTQVTFDFCVSGQLAGNRQKNSVVTFPDPSEAVEVAGLRTIPLERLIALKLVTWRRKDWADVIALVRNNGLSEDFANKLPDFLRLAYLQCYDEMKEEDRYDRELDEQ